MKYLFIINLLIIGVFNVLFASECPYSDPACHPLCVKYVGICKYCQCTKGGKNTCRTKSDRLLSGSRVASLSGSKSQDNWNSKIVGSYENTGRYYTGTSSTGSRRSEENTKVIIIHDKDTHTNPLSSLPGLPMGDHMPFNMPHGPMTAQNPFSRQISSYGNSINVPLQRPGIPKYCVAIDKMEFENCPCTVVDENGCQTCPCYSASRFWIAVRTKEQKPKTKEKKECVGTILCMMSCKGGYHLGETGPDGCQSCTCLKKVDKKPAPKKSEKECLKLYECIIKCSEKKLGFTVGGATSDGCRSCKCIGDDNKTGGSGGMTNTDSKWTMGGGGSMVIGNKGGGSMIMGNNGGGSMMMGNSNSGGGVNNFLKSPEKGVGINGGNGSKAKCNPPLVQCTNDGNTLMQSMPGGSGGSGGSSVGGNAGKSSGNGGGSLNSMSGGSGSGSGMKSPFSPSSGGSGSGGGMKSPFGSGSGGDMKSPFAGGGPDRGNGGGPGMSREMGPHGPQNPGFPSQKKVEETAYNENCYGPSCSAKDGGLVEGTLEHNFLIGNFRK